MRCIISLFTVLLVAFLGFAPLIQAQSLDLSQIRTMGTDPPEITAVATVPSYSAVGAGPAGSVETLSGTPQAYKNAESSAGRVVAIAWAGVLSSVVVGVALM